MAAPRQTLYDILGVSRDATSIDIGLAYQEAIAAADRATPPDATRQALLQQAHEILSNGPRRAAYDASLVTAAEKDAAKAQAAAPDLDLGVDEEGGKARRNLPWIPIFAAIAVIAFGAVLTLRNTPKPEPKTTEAPTPVPVAPAAPKSRSAAQILATALPSVGRVLSYDMSGKMTPVGLALAVEPAAMVTTCEGVSAGTQLVVKVGEESLSATLTMTDERLGLCQLLVTGANLKPLTISPDEARAGDAVGALGANEKGEIALTQGTIKQVRNTPSGPALELSMPIAKAGSGGAIFDTYGRVVGIATHREGAGVPTALPASALSALRSRARTP